MARFALVWRIAPAWPVISRVVNEIGQHHALRGRSVAKSIVISLYPPEAPTRDARVWSRMGPAANWVSFDAIKCLAQCLQRFAGCLFVAQRQVVLEQRASICAVAARVCWIKKAR